MTPSNPPGRVRTLFLGSGEFAIPSLERVGGYPVLDLVAVVTAPPRPSGRRQTPTPTPIGTAAHELGLGPVLTPARLRDPATLEQIRGLHPELVVLADYGRIVPAPLLALPHGALNLHPSLLPRHRGATPIAATILAGDTQTGVTLFRMDEGLDTGPIVAQQRVSVPNGATAPELEARLAVLTADLLERSLGPWLAGDLAAIPQSADGATLTRPLRREDGLLDPRRPAAALDRAVRAYQPWPGTYLVTGAGRLAVLDATVRPSGEGDVPGTIVAEDQGIALATVDGRLALDVVQPAGGRSMTGAAFRRGRPGIVGTQVKS
jgi:methionyl-tRNA formyltransferase